MTETGNSNQRVTNAILGEKLDAIAKDVKEIKDDMKLNTEYRIAGTERWKQHDKEHTSLNGKKWAGDIGAAVTGIAAAVTAAIVKQ